MFLIDYLSFTIKNISFSRVIELLDFQEVAEHFQDLGSLRRYEHCFKWGNINISTPYADRTDMGIFVDMSGQGCREYEDYFKTFFEDTYDWNVLFKKLVNILNNGCEVNIARIDLAYDDFTGLLKMPTIKRKLEGGEYVSRFKQFREVKSDILRTKSNCIGQTLYVGSKSSDCCCKFYDKRAEMYNNHKNDEYVIEQLDKLSHWIRFEITYKNELAINVVNMMLYSNDIKLEISAYINKCFRFINYDHTRTENCTISPFWVKFIGTDLTKKHTVLRSNLRGYNSTYIWFKKALAPTLCALLMSYGSPKQFIKDIIYNGGGRLTPQHNLIIQHMQKGKKVSKYDVWQTIRLNYANFYVIKPIINDYLDLTDYKPYHY